MTSCSQPRDRRSRAAAAQSRRPASRKAARRSDMLTTVEAVFAKRGGVRGLAEWAREHPGEFYRLYARLARVEVRPAAREPLVVEIVDLAKDRTP